VSLLQLDPGYATAQHPMGAEIWSFEKVDLGGYDSIFIPPTLVDQSSRDFSPNGRGIAVDQILVRF